MSSPMSFVLSTRISLTAANPLRMHDGGRLQVARSPWCQVPADLDYPLPMNS